MAIWLDSLFLAFLTGTNAALVISTLQMTIMNDKLKAKLEENQDKIKDIKDKALQFMCDNIELELRRRGEFTSKNIKIVVREKIKEE